MVPIIVGIAIVAAVVVLYAISYIPAKKVFEVAVKADVSKEQVMATNAEDADDAAEPSTEQKDRAWLRSQRLEIETIRAEDGTWLFGRVLRAEEPTDKWGVICHGYTGDGLKMGSAARQFHQRGFHVLLPDLRGCGRSGGDYYGMGWLDSQDMLQWFDRIIHENAAAKIVLTGGSMGGATTMMTTGLDLPSNVVAAVEDCGYTSVFDEFTYQLKKVFGLPKFPFMYIANRLAKKRAGYSFQEADSRKRLKNSTTPTLFIHGTADEFVPFHMMQQCYDAATCEKEQLVVEGAGHGLSAEVAPKLYWSTVETFINKYI